MDALRLLPTADSRDARTSAHNMLAQSLLRHLLRNKLKNILIPLPQDEARRNNPLVFAPAPSVARYKFL